VAVSGEGGGAVFSEPDRPHLTYVGRKLHSERFAVICLHKPVDEVY
jgi:hypothetical protein